MGFCKNPDCKKAYTEEPRLDTGYCSFECWEKINCLEPPKIQPEEITAATA